MEMEKFVELKETPKENSQPFVVYDGNLYILDGKTIYKMELPRETVWVKMLKFLGFKLY